MEPTNTSYPNDFILPTSDENAVDRWEGFGDQPF
jgi:hypothetical protein